MDDLEDLLGQIQATIDYNKKGTTAAPTLSPSPSTSEPPNRPKPTGTVSAWPSMRKLETPSSGNQVVAQTSTSPVLTKTPSQDGASKSNMNHTNNNLTARSPAIKQNTAPSEPPTSPTIVHTSPRLPTTQTTIQNNLMTSSVQTPTKTPLSESSRTSVLFMPQQVNGSPMMVILKNKMGELAAQIRAHSKEISRLEETKAQSVADENFEAAIAAKKELEEIQRSGGDFTTEMMRKCDLLKRGMAMERTLIESHSNFILAEKEKLDKRLESLENMKKDCVRCEDFEGALRFKQMIEDLHLEWKRKCEL